MFGNNIDTLLILSSVNRFYFSKLETTFGCVILHEDEKIFLTDFRYYTQAIKSLQGWKVVLTKSETFYGDINSTLTRLNAEVVGYEEKAISVALFEKIKNSCGALKFEPASDYLMGLRAIKTEEEIQKIASAQVIAQKSLAKVESLIKPGITEREVAANIMYEMQMLGAEDSAFETIVAFGENGSMPHHKTSKRKLKKNEFVTIDMGAKYDGYCSDMARTFCIGTPDPTLAEIHGVVREAQEYALANIKAGMTGHEADSFAREYIKAHGYGEKFGHGLGHGVGVELYEMPRLSVGNNTVLMPNMIITIEPGVYIEGLGGVRIEDIAVVKEDGLLNLTNFDKNINL